MRIAVTSDTHLGITRQPEIERLFKRMLRESPDIVIHVGDFSGGFTGHKTVALTCAMMRETFPDTPILSVLGNHDYWCGMGQSRGIGPHGPIHHRPSRAAFEENMEQIRAAFAKYDFFFLDDDGIFRDPRFPGVAICGHSGWYSQRVDTNDWDFLPKMLESETHAWLTDEAKKGLKRNARSFRDSDTHRLFVSHFPVIDPADFGWDARIGTILQKEFGVQCFIQGHFHERHEGPLHWESGSDYHAPRHLMIELDPTGGIR